MTGGDRERILKWVRNVDSDPWVGKIFKKWSGGSKGKVWRDKKKAKAETKKS